MFLTHSQTMTPFDAPGKKSFENTVGKGEIACNGLNMVGEYGSRLPKKYSLFLCFYVVSHKVLKAWDYEVTDNEPWFNLKGHARILPKCKIKINLRNRQNTLFQFDQAS